MLRWVPERHLATDEEGLVLYEPGEGIIWSAREGYMGIRTLIKVDGYEKKAQEGNDICEPRSYIVSRINRTGTRRTDNSAQI